MIEGVMIHELEVIRDPRGFVAHFMREDVPPFNRFGEVYFSGVNYQVVKGWHLHTKMTLNYVCVVGAIRLALYDDRDGSPTKGEVMDMRLVGYPTFTDYKLVTIPKGVWNGFRSLNWEYPAIIANLTDIPHDPEEIHRVPPRDAGVPYDWGPFEFGG